MPGNAFCIPDHFPVFLIGKRSNGTGDVRQRRYGNAKSVLNDKRGNGGLIPDDDRHACRKIERSLMGIIVFKIFTGISDTAFSRRPVPDKAKAARKLPGQFLRRERAMVEYPGAACIFLIIDEMYIEFIDDYLDYTAVPLTKEYENLAVIRSVSKFFAVPGLRFAYAVMNNPSYKDTIDRITTKNNIASLTAIAITEMFKDQDYIEESQSIVHTERSLVYLAMSTSKTIKLIKPDANFMLVKLLKDDITSSDVAAHCNQRGIIIRKCDDIRGLSNKYIRICFMNPKQNDLMVNTILEIV